MTECGRTKLLNTILWECTTLLMIHHTHKKQVVITTSKPGVKKVEISAASAALTGEKRSRARVAPISHNIQCSGR